MSAPTRDSVVQLSTAEYEEVWDHLGLGLRHWNLELPGGAVRTQEERTLQRERAWQGLEARGLARGRELAPQLEDALHVVARGPVEINGTVDTPDGRVRLVGVARGTFGVVAELYPQGLRLRFARDTPLPAAVLAPLPDRPAVAGTAVSAPADALATEAGLTGDEVEQALVRAGVRREDAVVFRQMIQGPRVLGGRFGAARRDQRGTRHPSEFVITYLATERGGCTVEQRRGPDRRPWITVAPAGKRDLGVRLARLLESVRV